MYDDGYEEQDEQRVDTQRAQQGQFVVCTEHGEGEDGGNDDVEGNILQGVVQRIVLLSHDIGSHHGNAIACKTSPGTGKITVAGYEQDVHQQQHGTAQTGEDSSPNGFVDDLIPERQVEVDAHHDFCCHDDGHNIQSRPVVATDDVPQNIHIAHYHKIGQQGEDDEILHGLGVHLVLVLVLDTGKDDGLVGKAERLRNHRHNHGYLRRCSVDA